MSTVGVTLSIDAPVERVWEVATDLPARARWLSTVTDVDVITVGQFAAGSVWRETRSVAGGTPVTEEFRVVECEPRRRFVVSSTGSGARYRMTYAFTPIHSGRHRGGTLVAVKQLGEPSDARGRVLGLVLGGLAAQAVEGALRQELADLSEAVRGGEGGSATAA